MDTENFLATLFKQFDDHIKRVVDQQVADIMMRQASMAVMDDALETKMRQLIVDIATDITDEAISDHERDNEHIDEDTAHDIAVTAFENYDLDDKIERSLNDKDMPDEDRVIQLVQDGIEEIDFEDKVNEVLQDKKFTVSFNQGETNADSN